MDQDLEWVEGSAQFVHFFVPGGSLSKPQDAALCGESHRHMDTLLSDYVSGEITLRDLHRCVRRVHKRAASVLLRIAELDRGDWSEDELKELLRRG